MSFLYNIDFEIIRSVSLSFLLFISIVSITLYVKYFIKNRSSLTKNFTNKNFFSSSRIDTVEVKFINNTLEKIWPAVYPNKGVFIQPDGKWEIDPKSEKTLVFPSNWKGKIWPRYKCNKNNVCHIGDCTRMKNSIICMEESKGINEYFQGDFDTGAVSLSVIKGSSLYSLKLKVKREDGVYETHSRTEGAKIENCPPENRVFSDKICDTPTCKLFHNSKARVESSNCFLNKKEDRESCKEEFIGCRSLCDSVTKGWLGYYVNKGNYDASSNDYNIWQSKLTKNSIKGPGKCDDELVGGAGVGNDLCRKSEAFGEKGNHYSGNLRELACCEGDVETGKSFGISPYKDCQDYSGKEMRKCMLEQKYVCPTRGMKGVRPNFSMVQKKTDKRPDWLKSSMGTDYDDFIDVHNTYTWKFHENEYDYHERSNSYILIAE